LHPSNVDFNQLLYGFDQAFGKRDVVLVEGAFDLYQIVCALLKNEKMSKRFGVVCAMGHGTSSRKLKLIAENFRKAYVLFDNDDAGITGTKAAVEQLSEFMPTFELTSILPKDKDPGKCSGSMLIDILNSGGAESKPFLERMMERWKSK
jgi:DNA primase